ncbi:MAG: hypothetical protein ACREMA_08055 [Longimicrobiales bacterium]
MRRVLFGAVSLGVLALSVVSIALPRPPLTSAVLGDLKPAIDGAASNLVRVAVDSAHNTIDLVIGPVRLAAHESGYRAPIQLAEVPISGWVRGFSWFVTDEAGQRLSDGVLHHFNLVDPDRTELFSPVALRIMGAGRETRAQTLPPLVAYPLTAGSRFLVITMLANPSPEPHVAYLTVRLEYQPERARLLRPVAIYPFYLDVMGPVGEKDFPVPPGRTVRSWEGSPRTNARILALGGHMHDHARRIELVDVTAGKRLWSVAPDTANGRVIGVPRGVAFHRGGIKLDPAHRYRVSVEYVNPTSRPAPAGGMGVIAGIVTTRAKWPELDRSDADYITDLANTMTMPARSAKEPRRAHMH